MTRKKGKGQVRLSLESLEDRMVLSSMGVLPLPTGTPPPALMSSSQLPGMTTTGANGQEYIVLKSEANGQQFGLTTGAIGQLPGGQLPGTMTIGANGQLPGGQLPGLTTIGANGQLPSGQLPGMTTTRAKGQEFIVRNSGTNGQLPDLTTTGASGQEHIIMTKSGTVGSKDQEQVVLKSGANGQQPGLTTTDRILREMVGTFGASDLPIGQNAS